MPVSAGELTSGQLELPQPKSASVQPLQAVQSVDTLLPDQTQSSVPPPETTQNPDIVQAPLNQTSQQSVLPGLNSVADQGSGNAENDPVPPTQVPLSLPATTGDGTTTDGQVTTQQVNIDSGPGSVLYLSSVSATIGDTVTENQQAAQSVTTDAAPVAIPVSAPDTGPFPADPNIPQSVPGITNDNTTDTQLAHTDPVVTVLPGPDPAQVPSGLPTIKDNITMNTQLVNADTAFVPQSVTAATNDARTNSQVANGGPVPAQVPPGVSAATNDVMVKNPVTNTYLSATTPPAVDPVSEPAQIPSSLPTTTNGFIMDNPVSSAGTAPVPATSQALPSVSVTMNNDMINTQVANTDPVATPNMATMDNQVASIEAAVTALPSSAYIPAPGSAATQVPQIMPVTSGTMKDNQLVNASPVPVLPSSTLDTSSSPVSVPVTAQVPQSDPATTNGTIMDNQVMNAYPAPSQVPLSLPISMGDNSTAVDQSLTQPVITSAVPVPTTAQVLPTVLPTIVGLGRGDLGATQPVNGNLAAAPTLTVDAATSIVATQAPFGLPATPGDLVMNSQTTIQLTDAVAPAPIPAPGNASKQATLSLPVAVGNQTVTDQVTAQSVNTDLHPALDPILDVSSTQVPPRLSAEAGATVIDTQAIAQPINTDLASAVASALTQVLPSLLAAVGDLTTGNQAATQPVNAASDPGSGLTQSPPSLSAPIQGTAAISLSQGYGAKEKDPVSVIPVQDMAGGPVLDKPQATLTVESENTTIVESKTENQAVNGSGSTLPTATPITAPASVGIISVVTPPVTNQLPGLVLEVIPESTTAEVESGLPVVSNPASVPIPTAPSTAPIEATEGPPNEPIPEPSILDTSSVAPTAGTTKSA